jgi:tetratricopeptide (TPR) repeat protein
VLEIPRALLAGEIAFRRGDREAGLERMREAVRLQDALKYNEAPDWMMPSRHALGAALLEAKRFDEAESVFRADLVQYPGNGWALFGLERALAGQGKSTEAAQALEAYRAAWKHADVTLRSPCFCQAG